MGRDGALGLLPNWVGGHMSVRPLPYLEGRCKNRPTCHRRQVGRRSAAPFKNFPLEICVFLVLEKHRSPGRSRERDVQGRSAKKEQGSRPRCRSTSVPADVSLSKTPSPPHFPHLELELLDDGGPEWHFEKRKKKVSYFYRRTVTRAFPMLDS